MKKLSAPSEIDRCTRLQERVRELEGELAVLRAQLAWLRKQLYGSKSERLEKEQLLLKLEELEKLSERIAKAKREQVSYERTVGAKEKRACAEELFAKLPVKEVVVIEPEEVRADPEAYERISEARTFEVDVVPPVLYKREIVRPKYRVKLDRSCAPVVAPAPARPVAGGYASAGLLAWIALSKYVDHQPLYRLEQMSARWGARLSRQSMAEWIKQTAQWLEPLYRRMHEELLARDYVQADETPVKFMDPDEPRGATRQGYLWALSRPGGDVVFDWRLSRRHGELTSLLQETFRGVLQSDGYEAYERYAQEHPGVVRAGCWAHARRKFFTAQETSPRESRVALRLIGRLYHWERKWDELGVVDAAERSRLRQGHLSRHLRWLQLLARHWKSRALPRSPLGQASHYLLGQWEALCAPLRHGQTRLDNNTMENAIRPSALGKKNWLFIGHPQAGRRSAIIYSLVVSCRRHGKDPHAYLRDVLSRLPRMTNQDDLGALLPSRWQPLEPATPA